MAKNNGKRNGVAAKEERHRLHPDTRRSIWAIAAIGSGILLLLAGFHRAGPAGEVIFNALEYLVGWGYFVIPLSLFATAAVLLFSERQKVVGITLLGIGLTVLALLGLIEIGAPARGGLLGLVFGALKYLFGAPAGAALNVAVLVIGVLVAVNTPLRLRRARNAADRPLPIAVPPAPAAPAEPEAKENDDESEVVEVPLLKDKLALPFRKKVAALKFKDYVPPPLDLLKSSVEKPTTGDLRANANIIKRTLESFGIPVEMGEINIGPKVTRYTLKPAEGVKLSRLVALNQDLALALAAHPIRIEAPIPGKSLVGIEVPNKAAAIVRLGSLMAFPEFQTAGPLGFTLGRDVTGEPIFANIEKMPHLLIAGATGSGKSVMIHSLLVSLLYKNSPASLKLILVDPKRVELSVYEGIPHLVSPVITESKKSVGVFRWAIAEMERRYDLLQKAGSRDVRSYNANLPTGRPGADEEERDPLPYLVIVVDELADIMTSYGREVEGSIVRLAQMARATGIHLILATQRPSVEIITGLIKANITSRIALQVASQIDSRTILDTSGAEKLLGGGDLLFVSSDLSKPRRIQGAFISEEEVNRVTDFIRENNQAIADESDTAEEIGQAAAGVAANGGGAPAFDDFLGENEDDDLYEEAVQTVAQAQKASASLLQRRLKVGYARAARLLDIMEERGVVGPGDGAKPREVFLNQPAGGPAADDSDLSAP